MDVRGLSAFINAVAGRRQGGQGLLRSAEKSAHWAAGAGETRTHWRSLWIV